MSEPIEGEYFNWLCAKVLPFRLNQYFDLMRILYQTEYVWTVAGDRNRWEDGCELKRYFARQMHVRPAPGWFSEPCSVLEMLIALADRAYFQTDRSAKDWFWEFMGNLMLGDYRHVTVSDIPVIEEVLQTFIWRTYEFSGHGGIFPLTYPKRDQRTIEIWYQFGDYLEDRGLI